MNSCPKCGVMNCTKSYRSGIQSYHLKGINRELHQKYCKGPYKATMIPAGDEHFELYCNQCGYGWIEKIIEALPGGKGPSY